MTLIGVMYLSAVLAQAPAAMHVGATVAPQCRIDVGAATTADAGSPSVRVTCGRRGLRVLRVTSDEGPFVRTIAPLETTSLRAGGEVVFVVPRAVGAVASTLPSMPSSKDPRPAVVVTLDF